MTCKEIPILHDPKLVTLNDPPSWNLYCSDINKVIPKIGNQTTSVFPPNFTNNIKKPSSPIRLIDFLVILSKITLKLPSLFSNSIKILLKRVFDKETLPFIIVNLTWVYKKVTATKYQIQFLSIWWIFSLFVLFQYTYQGKEKSTQFFKHNCSISGWFNSLFFKSFLIITHDLSNDRFQSFFLFIWNCEKGCFFVLFLNGFLFNGVFGTTNVEVFDNTWLFFDNILNGF